MKLPKEFIRSTNLSFSFEPNIPGGKLALKLEKAPIWFIPRATVSEPILPTYHDGSRGPKGPPVLMGIKAHPASVAPQRCQRRKQPHRRLGRHDREILHGGGFYPEENHEEI